MKKLHQTRPVLSVSLLLLAASTLSSEAQVGAGVYNYSRGLEAEAHSESLSILDQAEEIELKGELITQPTKVRGNGSLTVVAGNVLINKSSILETGTGTNTSLVEVNCPVISHGGTVIIRGNKIINSGDITGIGSSSVGTVVVDCDLLGTSRVFIENNTITNNGNITANQ